MAKIYTFSPQVSNPKPQIIIPTGSSFVLDELYQGECIQIGGTLSNMFYPISTNLYIKCRNDNNEVKYVHISLANPEEKIIISPALIELSFNSETRDILSLYDVAIYKCLFDENPAYITKGFPDVVGLRTWDNALPMLKDLSDYFSNHQGLSFKTIDKVVATNDYWQSFFEQMESN